MLLIITPPIVSHESTYCVVVIVVTNDCEFDHLEFASHFREMFSDPRAQERLDQVLRDFAINEDNMKGIKSAFLLQMEKGWFSSEGRGSDPADSSLKMLTSHVNVFATGRELGVYYAIDLGGSNLRVLRVELNPNLSPVIDEIRCSIPATVRERSATHEKLFGFIASTAKQLTDKHKETTPQPVGFTFSFPMSQESISSAKLIEWTKGFETSDCVGKDPAALLTEAFTNACVPLHITALCNDTVGTLMTCAYEFKGCPTCRIGVILGTGTNAAYVDPSLKNLIVNIEWGGFNSPTLRRNPFDDQLDKSSPNPGKQFLEKIVSGMYLGELARLATVYVLGEGNHMPPQFSTPFAFETADLSEFLSSTSTMKLDEPESTVLTCIGNAVLDRSACICAAALSAVADKTLNTGRRNSSVDGTLLTIGVDGSLFTKCFRYPERLSLAMTKVCGSDFASQVKFVRSNDGSGVGAAVIAAALTHQ